MQVNHRSEQRQAASRTNLGKESESHWAAPSRWRNLATGAESRRSTLQGEMERADQRLRVCTVVTHTQEKHIHTQERKDRVIREMFSGTMWSCSWSNKGENRAVGLVQKESFLKYGLMEDAAVSWGTLFRVGGDTFSTFSCWTTAKCSCAKL